MKELQNTVSLLNLQMSIIQVDLEVLLLVYSFSLY